MTDKLILGDKKTQIEIRQKDWRDDFFIYEILKNHKIILEIDTTKTDIEKAVELLLHKIKSNL